MKEMKPQYIYRATVEKVVDGDTVDLLVDCGFNIIRKERIRFYGVDAWEPRGEERERGLEAKAFVIEHCPVGSEVVVVTGKEKGKFGRYLGEIFINNKSLNNLLLENGHAEVYR
jgi:micrococcal nuclease|tara:strand:+ start:713 stop:1054 length:342 start_codon:yes stop_codon:yes gene_type:complete